MPRVLVLDILSSRASDVFLERGIEVDEKSGSASEELLDCLDAYDGLVLRSATKVTKELLEAASQLKVIGRAGIGVDNIDLYAATTRGVVVMNTPLGNSITTAAHTIAMLLALVRQIPEAKSSTHAGKWEKTNFLGVEVFGKTLGIIGCGNVGSIVADRALGLKMKVIAYDPYLSVEHSRDLGVEKVTFDALLNRANFITLHTPITEATRNIIDKNAIQKMKHGVYLINCARGNLIVEQDLKDGLISGKIAGAALDVYVNEPAHKNPLFGLTQVIVTPHLGAATIEAQENVAIQIAEQVSDYLLKGSVANALNMASISAEDGPKLKPYIKLTGQLGSFLGQVVNFDFNRIRVEFEGHVAGLNTKPLTAVALEGLLKHLMESVNMVNAPHIARERDIEVIETTNERSPQYQSLVRMTVDGSSNSQTVSGTLFSDNQPRIVEVNDISVEAELSQNMLFIRNDDLPGFIGLLGQALGDAQVNIATFQLGRREAGGEAMSLIATDGPVGSLTLEAINSLPLVKSALLLKFV